MGRILAVITVFLVLVLTAPITEAKSVRDYQNGNQYEWSQDINTIPSMSISAGILAMRSDPNKFCISNAKPQNLSAIIKSYLPETFSSIADTISNDEKGVEISFFGSDTVSSNFAAIGLPLLALRFDSKGGVELSDLGIRFDTAGQNVALTFSMDGNGIRLN